MAARIAKGRPRRRHFFREWRLYRGLTQEQLAERLETSKASISRLESGDQPYSQEVLEAMADALSCEPADLIMRNPLDTEAIWSIWEQAKPSDRAKIVSLARIVVSGRTGTEG